MAPRVPQIDHRVAAARAVIENLRPDELVAELARSCAIVLVDVRGVGEHRSGTISGSINVPRGTIELALGDIVGPADRLVLFCESGARSALAAAALYAIGYRDVAQLDGGLAAWRAAGHPVNAPATSG